MILVPKNSKGVKIVRPLEVFGTLDSPQGHAEIQLDSVRVPLENILIGEGKGFEIAQGRLGPGRVHHCMRLIGAAERSLELMCRRVKNRKTFGKELSKYSSIRQEIATSKCSLEQARLLTLATADKIDKYGSKEAKDLIAMIKIVVPKITCEIVDKAIQIHGGMGVCDDTPLPIFWLYARTLRIADGPDEVHMYQLGRNIINSY
jgi:acyl-CoA dehydrogenase